MANFLSNLLASLSCHFVVAVAARNNGCLGDQPCLVNAPIEHNNKMERQLASKNPCQFYSISFYFVAAFLLPCPAMHHHRRAYVQQTRGMLPASLPPLCIVMPPQAKYSIFQYRLSSSLQRRLLDLVWYVPGMESKHLFLALTCTKVPQVGL